MSGARGLPAGAWHIAGLTVGAAVVWLASAKGLWEGPLVVAALWAFAVPTARQAYGGAVAMAVLGYGAALAAIAVRAPLGAAASDVAAIMGFGHAALIVWALTAVLALAQALAGAWAGRAVALLLAAGPA